MKQYACLIALACTSFLTYAQPVDKKIVTHRGARIIVELDNEDLENYVWELDTPLNNMMVMYLQKEQRKNGENWLFQTLERGNTIIRFVYNRRGQPQSAEGRRYTVELDIR